MRILITGGAGCLGSNLIERYLERGHDVLVIDNFATGHRGSLPDAHPRLTVVEGSIADRALRGPDVRRLRADACHSFGRRLQGSGRLARGRAHQRRGNDPRGRGCPRRLASSASSTSTLRSAMAGRTSCRSRSTAPARPFTSYGISKQAGENYLAMSGLPFVSLRLANVTGPRLAIGPIPTFYTRLKAGKPCFCSKTVRDFLDMDDFFAVMDAVMDDGAPTGIFNVSTGTGHSIKEIFDDRRRSSRRRARRARFRKLNPGRTTCPRSCSIRRRRCGAFGWAPRYSFEQTIRRMLAWYDMHGVTAIYSHLKAPAPVRLIERNDTR